MDPLTPEEVTALEAEQITNPDLLRALRTIRDRERENICDVCAGSGNPGTGLPCACGGTGRASDAVPILRTYIVKVERERDELQRRCDKYENEAAEVCPEDQSLKETFGALRKERQRLWDLVRQQRMELFQADLITREEYAELAKDHPAVARLETYDGIRARLKTAEAERDELQRKLSELQKRADKWVDLYPND